MRFKGSLKALSRDFATGKINLQFEMEEGNMNEIDTLRDVPLSIEAKKFYKGRTNKQNALLWECFDQIGKAMNPPLTKDEVHDIEVQKWGVFESVFVKSTVADKFVQNWKENGIAIVKERDETISTVLCYFRTRYYNTKEFSHFLDGVIRDMEDMGLPRPTSYEMEMMLKQWEESTQNR